MTWTVTLQYININLYGLHTRQNKPNAVAFWESAVKLWNIAIAYTRTELKSGILFKQNRTVLQQYFEIVVFQPLFQLKLKAFLDLLDIQIPAASLEWTHTSSCNFSTVLFSCHRSFSISFFISFNCSFWWVSSFNCWVNCCRSRKIQQMFSWSRFKNIYNET